MDSGRAHQERGLAIKIEFAISDTRQKVLVPDAQGLYFMSGPCVRQNCNMLYFLWNELRVPHLLKHCKVCVPRRVHSMEHV